MWCPRIATGRSQHISGQSSQKTPRLQRAEPPGGHDDSTWTAAPWLSNLERRPIQRAPVTSRSISISSYTSHALDVRAAMNTEPNVAARSEPVKGALVPAGRGTKVASMSGAKEPYIPSAEAVEFFAVAIGQRFAPRRNAAHSHGNRMSPGKVGSRRAGIGRIDPGTTVRGINTEDTCRLRRIEHRPSPCRSPLTAHQPNTERREPSPRCPGKPIIRNVGGR